MNTLIYEIAESGLSMSYYSAINTAACVISLCYSLWHGKKLGISLWKMLIILFVVYMGQSTIQGLIHNFLVSIKEVNLFGIETAVNSIVRTFVFLPLIAFPLALIFRLKWSFVCDAIALFPLLTSALGQLACIFPGCCRGHVCSWGIYNIKTEQYHFPVQIFETILTLAIFIYLVCELKRRKYVSDGMLYPEMMTLYGLMRFICEGLRDNEKIFLGCSAVAIHAFVMFVIGFAIILYKEQKTKKAMKKANALSEENILSAEEYAPVTEENASLPQ